VPKAAYRNDFREKRRNFSSVARVISWDLSRCRQACYH